MKIKIVFIILLLQAPATQGAVTNPSMIQTEGTIDRIKHTMYSLVANLQSFYQKDIFPKDEYEQYMKLIQELDPTVYTKLRIYEQTFKEPAFLKAIDRKPTVLVPKKETHGQPIMVLPPLLDKPRKKQKKALARFLQSYTALANSQHYQQKIDEKAKALEEWKSKPMIKKVDYYETFIRKKIQYLLNRFWKAHKVIKKPPIPFSQEEYNRYMQLIKDKNPTVYEQLKKYEADFSEPALLKAESYLYDTIIEKNGHAVIVIYPEPNGDAELEESNLFFTISSYKNFIPQKELTEIREKALAVIKYIAPGLYEEIIKIDPTGKDHLILLNNVSNCASVKLSSEGLPIITLGTEMLKLPQEELRFALGHELGHYVLGHFTRPLPIHTTLKTQSSSLQNSSEDKKANQLPFEETLCSAYSRENEYEADRFSILTMRTNVDAAITWFQKLILNETHQKNTSSIVSHIFLRSHPQSQARIEHFESLRCEVKLQKTHGEMPVPIDWHALIAKYKNSCWEEM